jgi:hypothetical protein
MIELDGSGDAEGFKKREKVEYVIFGVVSELSFMYPSIGPMGFW